MSIAVHTMEYYGGLVVAPSTPVQPYFDHYYTSYKAVYEACFHEMRKALGLEPIDDCHPREELISKQNSIWVLLKDEVLIGAVSINENEIDDLIVRKECQRKGYGTSLLNFAIHTMQVRGISPIILRVTDWNKNAMDLYLKNHFKIVKTETFL
ncbi:MAG: GNAT family N-acetyltransferase [Christensenellaceae bacterium]|nr:GNAT family N-acetyltransferase [Christensenellaceae bacterium]